MKPLLICDLVSTNVCSLILISEEAVLSLINQVADKQPTVVTKLTPNIGVTSLTYHLCHKSSVDALASNLSHIFY